MIIRHDIPKTSFTRIDRYVFTRRDLKDGPKVLYGYLCGLRNGANFSDAYIMQAMGITKNVLAERKRKLKEAGLILVDQIDRRTYVLYIGHSKLTAAQVKQGWAKEDDVLRENV